MEAINNTERRITFLKFLAFFTITVGLVVLAVFVDYQIPFKELELHKSKNAELTKEMEYQLAFSSKMKDVMHILDSINIPGQNPVYLEQLSSTKLATMKESVSSDATLKQKAMYDYIIQTLLTLQSSSKSLRESKRAEALISQYELQIKDQKSTLENTRRDLDICRQLSAAR